MPTIWGCPNQLLNRSAGPAGAHAGTVPRYAELAELAGQWEHAPGFAYIKETTETVSTFYNPITAMGFSAMFTFQLDNTKR